VSRAKSAAAGACVLAVIGAGAFARTVLLPGLAKLPNLKLDTVVTERGISAEHTQERFGFENVATTPEVAFDNPAINAVLIATPHASHARLTAAALRAGKAVLVEKPLALNRDELNEVIAARNGSSGFFQVGFNRRFAPMAAKMKAHLARLGGPKFVLIRVNAGQLPPESWQAAPEQGNGRILGEVCHFIDLARHLVGARIASVAAAAARPSRAAAEDVTVTLNFTDGSLATIAYTALGAAGHSKELIEAYAGGTVATIDDFREFTVATGGKVKRQRAMLDQDKGHQAELAAFVKAGGGGGPVPIDEIELIETSLATIAALESLQSGAPVKL
jgi:predicted dehydrogenase